MTAEGVAVSEGPGVAASRAEEREKDIFTKSEKWLPAMPLPGKPRKRITDLFHCRS